MAKTITSRPNIFGGTSHYDEHGKKIGESRPAIFGGTNHYDAKGHKIGYSRPGMVFRISHSCCVERESLLTSVTYKLLLGSMCSKRKSSCGFTFASP